MMLVIDWETTGLMLHPDADVRLQPRAIEFGAALVVQHDGSVSEEASILINPGIPLDADIQRITGLTDADLKDAPPFIDVLPQLRRLFAEAEVLVAHNLPFDRGILRGELIRNNITEFPWPPREICTVGLYRDLWGRNPKLKELYEAVIGKPLAQTHRALDDVRALVEIIQREYIWRL